MLYGSSITGVERLLVQPNTLGISRLPRRQHMWIPVLFLVLQNLHWMWMHNPKWNPMIIDSKMSGFFFQWNRWDENVKLNCSRTIGILKNKWMKVTKYILCCLCSNTHTTCFLYNILQRFYFTSSHYNYSDHLFLYHSIFISTLYSYLQSADAWIFCLFLFVLLVPCRHECD